MKSELTDEELIRIYFPDQPRYCFDILYQRYYQTIYHQCRELTQNAEQAQDIFLKVFLKLSSFQQRARFSTTRRPGWIYAVAHNYCRDQMRLDERLPTTAISENLAMSLVDKIKAVSHPEVIRRFSLALASLSETEQALLRFKYEQGLSLQELAQLSGLSVSALNMRLKRSREKIQLCYAKQLGG